MKFKSIKDTKTIFLLYSMLTLYRLFKHQSIEFRLAELGLPSHMSVYAFFFIYIVTSHVRER